MAGPLFNEPSTNTAAINTNVVIDLAAITGSRRVIKHVSWSLDVDADAGAANVARLTIESPAGTVLHDYDISKAGPGFIEFPNAGIPGAEGQVLRAKITNTTNNTIATLNIMEGNA